MAKTEMLQAEMPKDPWKEMKEVFIERGSRNEPKSLFVSVNGRDFMVPKGKAVNVPAPIARRVELYKKAQAHLMDKMAELENSSAAPDQTMQFRQF